MDHTRAFMVGLVMPIDPDRRRAWIFGVLVIALLCLIPLSSRLLVQDIQLSRDGVTATGRIVAITSRSASGDALTAVVDFRPTPQDQRETEIDVRGMSNLAPNDAITVLFVDEGRLVKEYSQVDVFSRASTVALEIGALGVFAFFCRLSWKRSRQSSTPG